jgi:acetylornithine deacetylase/succinyl-diaminopimelate desuccinylase-like protein
MNRRIFFGAIIAALLTIAGNRRAWAAGEEFAEIKTQITQQHDEAVKRLQDWIHQVSIAAENRGYPEGPDYMITLLKDAGFDQAVQVPTDGKPGVFATLDAGAKKTIGIYFMYDVKQFDPAEWSSPPTDAAIVDKPGLGKSVVGRGAVNQKGPEAAFLAALHAIRASGKKLPVNLAFVAEGEEEIGSPHFPQIVHKPEVQAALAKCDGVFIPSAEQDPDGTVTLTLGAKGVVECELTSSGEKWGRGPKKDVHSSNKARLDSPAWHLVQALHTLVTDDGQEPAIDNYTKNVRPITADEKTMVATASKRLSEAQAKKLLSADHWLHDVNWEKAIELWVSRPTVNIEGLVGGYTGPGGKTVLPHKAVAKIDMRLVPNMTASDALAALKAHLAKRGFGDIDVNMTGGYDPNSTAASAGLIKAQIAVLKNLHNIDPILLPRSAGSWPGYVFTGAPLNKPAGHFGLGHGSGAHAPDEYFVVESSNPKIEGMDGATMSYVEYLYELAKD